MSVAAAAPDRVHGLVMGNTWFWPADSRMMNTFGIVMSSPPVQWSILKRNFFVKRVMPMAMATKLTDEEKEHYRAVQPDAGGAARRGGVSAADSRRRAVVG